MSAVDALAPAANALLRHLAWEAWLSTAVFGVVAATTTLLPRRFCGLRQLLWMLVLARLLLPTDLATPFSVWRLVGLDAVAAPSSPGASPDAAEAVPDGAVALRAVPSAPAGIAPSTLPVSIAALWAAGVALVGAVLSRRRRHFRRLARRAEPVLDPRLLGRVAHWRAAMGVRRRVRLLRSDAVAAPFTVGSLAPRVVLPGRVADGGGSALADCVLAHEMAHIGRWDDLTLQVQTAVASLYFFHPVAWLAFRFSREEADRACDLMAVARGRIPARTYGASLVALVSRVGVPFSPVPALAPTLRQVMARLEVLVHSARPVPGRVPSLAAVVAFGVVLQPSAGCDGRCADAAGAAVEARGPGAASGVVVERAAAGPAPRARAAPMVADPLPGSRITNRFGLKHRLPNGELRRHRGADYGAAVGTPVLAAAQGIVVFAGDGFVREPHLGRVIIVDHGGGVRTLYGHLDAVAVARGSPVEPGTPIGTVGTSGYATGPHLHFEVRRDDVPVCPGFLGSLLGARGGGSGRGACKPRVVPERPAAA